MAKKIKVLIVDDHALVRSGFRRILEDEGDLKVIGEAGDGEQAVQMARQLNPSLVVMDCSLPGMNGLVAAAQILRSCPETRVLMLSMHKEEALVKQAHKIGASGYVLKDIADFDLVSAIRRVAAGELVFEAKALDSATPREKQPGGLSTRELEVLQYIVNGKSNREIAEELGLSANTIAAHRANILSALHLKKTAELVTYAIRNGLANIL